MLRSTKKILIFSTSYLPRIGGAELAIKHITDRLSNYEFHLITSRYDPALSAQEKIGNIKVFRVGGRWSLVYLFLPKIFFPFVAWWWALKFDRQFGPYDILFVSQASQAGGAAWLFKKFRPRARIVLNLQEGQNLAQQSWLKRLVRGTIIRCADRVVCISHYLKQIALDYGVQNQAITVIPNGVDEDFFTPTLPTGGSQIVMSVSRLVSKNGLDILLKAIPLCHTPSLRLLLVGDGGQERELKTLAHSLGIEQSVEFRGSVNHSQLPLLLPTAGVFVRPSRSEGLGSAFLEAMAAYVPVIGTPVGGIPDFLRDGETGLFCKPEDPSSLAHAIDRLFADEQLRASIIKNARDLVEKKYRWEPIAKEYDTLFQTLT